MIGAGPPPDGFGPFLGRCHTASWGELPAQAVAAALIVATVPTVSKPSPSMIAAMAGTNRVRPLIAWPPENSLVPQTTWNPSALMMFVVPPPVTEAGSARPPHEPTS